MSSMKCPYCNEELIRHWGMKEPALYCCDNPKCSRGGVATERSWQELTKTKQLLGTIFNNLDTVSQEYFRATFPDQIKQITEIQE